MPEIIDATPAPILPETRHASWEMYIDLLNSAKLDGIEAEREVERWLGRNDLFYLMCRILRRDDVNQDYLFERCREIEQKRDNHLDLWAREHYKSTLITFGMTIQDILIDPEITVGIFSHTRPIAKSFLRQIKQEFEQNTVLQWLYSDVLYTNPQKEATKWSEDDGITVRRRGNPKEATVEAWGLVDGQPTGRHFKLRVYDDVVTRDSVTTPEQIAKTTAAWEMSDNLGHMQGAVRYIGTRYHLHDTYNTMMDRGAAIPRIHAATHNGRFDGRPLFFTEAEWNRRLKTQSRATVASQLLQNPMADSSATFQTLWLKSYELRPRTLNVYILIDPSRGRSATSDNTAMSVVGISATGTKYLLDGFVHRMTLSERWRNMRNLYLRWSRMPGVQHVEVGYERYGAQSDDEYFEERMIAEKIYFNIVELNWPRDGTESKRERVERLEPDFRNSRFLLPLPVWHDSKPMIWTVQADPELAEMGKVSYVPSQGLTKNQLKAVADGAGELVAKVIRQKDQDGKTYDVTVRFIQEFSEFPFGMYKDLVDATSRIYDMEPTEPVMAMSKMKTEPNVFVDS